jgi:hypothetical protein
LLIRHQHQTLSHALFGELAQLIIGRPHTLSPKQTKWIWKLGGDVLKIVHSEKRN